MMNDTDANKDAATSELAKNILANNKKLLSDQYNNNLYIGGLKRFIMECEMLLLQHAAFMKKLADELAEKGVVPTSQNLNDMKHAIDQAVPEPRLRKDFQDILERLFKLRDLVQQQLAQTQQQLMQVQSALNQMISTGIGNVTQSLLQGLSGLVSLVQSQSTSPQVKNAVTNAATKAHDLIAQHGTTVSNQAKNGQVESATNNPVEFLTASFNYQFAKFNNELQLQLVQHPNLTEEDKQQISQYQAEYHSQMHTQFTGLLLKLSIPALEMKEKIADLEKKIEQYQQQLVACTQEIEQLQNQNNMPTPVNQQPTPGSGLLDKVGKDIVETGVDKGVEKVVKDDVLGAVPSPFSKIPNPFNR